MSTIHTPLPDDEHPLDALIRHGLARADAPGQVDAEELVALGERRLFPREEARVVAAIRADRNALMEFAGLYPDRCVQVFGSLGLMAEDAAADSNLAESNPAESAALESAAPDSAVPDSAPPVEIEHPARLTRPRTRLVAWITAVTAAAVVLGVSLWPSGPERSHELPGLQVSTQVFSNVRGASPTGEGLILSSGQRLQIELALPALAEGQQAWGSILSVDEAGQSQVLCASHRPGDQCVLSPGGLSHMYQPSGPGARRWFFLVMAPDASADWRIEQSLKTSLTGTEAVQKAQALSARLTELADQHGWRIKALPEVSVQQ